MMAGPAITEFSAYVPGFDEDIFISYAHIDNPPYNQWVTALHTFLQYRVTQILGSNVRVYRDLKLNGIDAFWEVLRERISRSAIFLPVLSPRYVRSDSCRKEAALFGNIARGSGQSTVQQMSRIVRVIKTPYPSAAGPDALQETETLGFRFYDQDPLNPASFQEFNSDKDADPDGHQKFSKSSENLAQAIAKLLSAMHDSRQSVPPAFPKRTVFVAGVTSDLRTERETVINTLSGQGCQCVPSEELPVTLSGLNQVLERDLKDSRLAIHLMGARAGLVPEGAQHAIVRLQFEAARSRGLRQLVWIPPDLPGVEDTQKQFLSAIEHSGDERCDIIKERFGLFVDCVRDELGKRPKAATNIRAKSVYLMCDKADLSRTWRKQIRSFLIDQGYPVFDPAFEGDVSVIRELEADNIKENEATLIYYGTAADAWVLQKRRTILKTLASAEHPGKRVRAVYLCTPDSDVKQANYLGYDGDAIPEQAGFTPLMVLGDCTPFTPDKLRPLLDQLEAGDV